MQMSPFLLPLRTMLPRLRQININQLSMWMDLGWTPPRCTDLALWLNHLRKPEEVHPSLPIHSSAIIHIKEMSRQAPTLQEFLRKLPSLEEVLCPLK